MADVEQPPPNPPAEVPVTPAPATTPGAADVPAPGAAEGAGLPAGSVAVPPWVQLVGLPLLVLFAWVFASAASHAVVVFLIAGITSLLLSPLVRGMTLRGVPRPIAVLVVFATFVMILVMLSAAAVNLTVDEAERLQRNLPGYTQRAQEKVTDLQGFLDRRGVHVDLRDQGIRFLTRLEEKSSEISREALTFGQEFVRRVAEAIFNVVLIVVISIYMLLDAPRIARRVAGAFPSHSNVDLLFRRLEQALLNYVRGQTMASLVMGASATVGLWVIGVTGLWPAAAGLALVFGLIVAITEFAPSIGPVIGAVPPIVAALFDGIVPAVAVLVFFTLLHQIEGHIVLPKLMGAAIAVHPLLVIFAIIAGAQIMGPLGIILALPLLALGREIVLFTRERVTLQRWPHATAGMQPFAETAATAGIAAQRMLAQGGALATAATATAGPAGSGSTASSDGGGERLMDRLARQWRWRRRSGGGR